MPKFTSQILLLFSKVLHILENLLLKKLHRVESCFLNRFTAAKIPFFFFHAKQP